MGELQKHMGDPYYRYPSAAPDRGSHFCLPFPLILTSFFFSFGLSLVCLLKLFSGSLSANSYSLLYFKFGFFSLVMGVVICYELDYVDINYSSLIWAMAMVQGNSIIRATNEVGQEIWVVMNRLSLLMEIMIKGIKEIWERYLVVILEWFSLMMISESSRSALTIRTIYR